MNKYKTGLVIGRFQPVHNGHVYLIKKALEVCEKIIIGIGSSNISDKNNPWSYEKRLEMLNKFIKNKGLENKVLQIFPSPDIPDDNTWFEDTVKKAGKFDIVIGNNDWVREIFEKHNFRTFTVNHYRREELEGYKIRELMRKKKKWKDRVPDYIAALIKIEDLSD